MPRNRVHENSSNMFKLDDDHLRHMKGRLRTSIDSIDGSKHSFFLASATSPPSPAVPQSVAVMESFTNQQLSGSWRDGGFNLGLESL